MRTKSKTRSKDKDVNNFDQKREEALNKVSKLGFKELQMKGCRSSVALLVGHHHDDEGDEESVL